MKEQKMPSRPRRSSASDSSTNSPIDLEQLRNDPASFLYWRFDDPVLRKLETYRLYRLGYSVTEITRAFEFARNYPYQMWEQFEVEGTSAFYKKNCGSTARKVTQEFEAALIRAKAIDPERSDADLAEEFQVHRTTVYRTLKEHGIQDLHKIIKRNC